MLFGGTIARKGFFQHFEVGHFVYVEHAPVGETSGTTLASNLVAQQAGLSILHSVVVRLDDSWLALVGEAYLMARVDGAQELAVDFWELVAYH